MSTGLFSHRHNLGRNARSQPPSAETKLNIFADHLAEHGDTARAARAIGASPSYGRVLLGKLRKRLGWQAQ